MPDFQPGDLSMEQNLAHACFDLHVHSPILSGLVPSLVGLVGSENKEQSKETRGEGEGVHGKSQNRSILSTEHSGVDSTNEIGVFSRKHVPEHDKGSNQSDNQNLTTDILVNSGLCCAEKVLEESIRRSVLDPVFVAVDRSAVLSGFLSVWDFAVLEAGNTEWIERDRGGSLHNVVAVGNKGNSVANGASCQQDRESNFHHLVEYGNVLQQCLSILL